MRQSAVVHHTIDSHFVPVQSEHILELVHHTLLDTITIVPILFVLYLVLEYISHKRGFDLIAYARISGKLGPLAGTLLGLIPECGMSVFVTTLYLSRRVTLGTLVGTYLATSDEALPVIFASSLLAGPVLKILAAKAVIGIVAGYAIDLLWRNELYAGESRKASSSHAVEVDTELDAADYRRIAFHTLKRTLRIYLWILGISIVLGWALSAVNLAALFEWLRVRPLLEIPLTALFGLIPNCAASITIAQAYLTMGLTFGAAIAGLSAGAGYGPIVLLKDGDFKAGFRVLLFCLTSSILAGLALSFLF